MSVSVKINQQPINNIVNSFNKSLSDTALEAAKLAKQSMREPKSGRVYRYRYKVGVGITIHGRSKGASITYRASAPGEAPAVRSSNLFKSVEAYKVYDDLWYVGSPVEYAGKLEMGHGRIAARPWLKPAILKAGGKFTGYAYKRIKD